MLDLYDVLIIGGGAAGLASALQLQSRGLRIALIERNPRIGKKLLVTGNGRCNYTNIDVTEKDYGGAHPDFVRPALEAFTPQDAISFFRRIGIEPRIEAKGKVFPASEQAGSFLDLFLIELEAGDAHVFTDTFIQEIVRENDLFFVKASDKTFRAKRVLLTTGGKAMPSSGSDGNGYALAEALGHTVTPLSPALVQLMLEGDFFKRIEGVKLRRRLHLGVGKEILHSEEGDLLFASYGLSGPAALQLSRPAARLLAKGEQPWVSVELFPHSSGEMYALLQERFSYFPQRPLSSALIGLIHKRLIQVLIAEAQLEKNTLCGDLSGKELSQLARILVDWRLPLRDLRSWPSAQVTSGGVASNEVNPHTMESKLSAGLYFAGEILDVDGRSGGFNLQWAWSSAAIASRALLEELC